MVSLGVFFWLQKARVFFNLNSVRGLKTLAQKPAEGVCRLKKAIGGRELMLVKFVFIAGHSFEKSSVAIEMSQVGHYFTMIYCCCCNLTSSRSNNENTYLLNKVAGLGDAAGATITLMRPPPITYSFGTRMTGLITITYCCVQQQQQQDPFSHFVSIATCPQCSLLMFPCCLSARIWQCNLAGGIQRPCRRAPRKRVPVHASTDQIQPYRRTPYPWSCCHLQCL